MKTLKNFSLVFILGLWAHIGCAQDQEEVKWHTNFNEALTEAKAEHKPILISFAGSDWCKPCIKLSKEVFDDSKFKDYAKENLVLMLADFPRLRKNQPDKDQIKANEALAAKYNKAGSFPLVVLIDSDEHVITQTGYQAGGSDNFISFLEKATEK
ncbi:thioredoxin family protein [Fulvivirga sediminis]|uniref:Thioredoxin family protein n=1 Tax=Fulvivirga sediminis TaxID=2803949 RepID=A0A937FBN4_9BACT|nr:DUF255 domain-containing protein [Fulvivirga sediminis]MBL3657900.1 thioredoxin family protein [Fulvivirga sediminis]